MYQELDVQPTAFEKQTRKILTNFLARGAKSGVALEARGEEWADAITISVEKFRHFADRLGVSYMEDRGPRDIRRLMAKVHLQSVHPGRFATEHDVSQHLNSQAQRQRLGFPLTFPMWFREVHEGREAPATPHEGHHPATVVKRDGKMYHVKILKRADIRAYLQGRLGHPVVERAPAQRWST